MLTVKPELIAKHDNIVSTEEIPNQPNPHFNINTDENPPNQNNKDKKDMPQNEIISEADASKSHNEP